MSVQLSGKKLELLKEVVPGLARVAYLSSPAYVQDRPTAEELSAAARALETQLHIVKVQDARDLPGAFEAAVGEGAGAVLVPGSILFVRERAQIASLAIRAGLPTMFEFKEFVEAGGLMAYGVEITEYWRAAAAYVDKILKGARPADLPVQQPTRFDFTINLKTAQALGIAIPQHVLLQATEVLQ
jgi:putative ABC transport system substrate-binding protein